MNRVLLVFLVLVFAAPLRGQPGSFSVDSASSWLQVIAGEIGPRPMGSPAEQRALAYAAAKFAGFGCDTAYVMRIDTAQGINTSTGVAVGVVKGSSGRIIVIGGHMDSAGPEIPGACDDGSGAACVLECARVLARQDRASTIILCCWGGEEDGLRGSNYFVDHFDGIDSVVLMLQIDMADGSSYLEAYIDGPNQVSAPRWLTRAAFDLFYGELEGKGLLYNTHMSSVNSSGEGAMGSDHDAFLRKGIPAIAFVSDAAYPIHTPQDDLTRFTRSGLKRTGDLVLALAKKFDGGIPERTTETYYLVQWGATLFFFSHVMLWVGVAAAAVAALVAWWVAWRRRKRIEPRVRWSGLKLLLVVVLIQICIWCSEILIGAVMGVRFPWVNRFEWFVVLGLLCGIIGIWLSVLLARRMHFSREPYGYYVRSLLWLVVFMIPLVLMNAELALYPAWAMLCIGLAIVVRMPWLKLLLVLLSPYLVLRLVFLEGLGLLQRGLALIPLEGALSSVLYNGVFVVAFSLLSLPFAYAFAGAYRESGVDFFGLRRWRLRNVGGAALGLAMVVGIVLARGEVYSDGWRRNVRLAQQYSYGADSSRVKVSSSEYLDGLTLRYDGRDTVLTDRRTTFRPRLSSVSAIPWLVVRETEQRWMLDSLRMVERRLELSSAFRPLQVTITYRGEVPFGLSTTLATGSRFLTNPDTPRKRTLAWYSYPDTFLHVPVSVRLDSGRSVIEEIEVVYDRLAYPLSAHRALTNVSERTTVTRTDTIVWTER